MGFADEYLNKLNNYDLEAGKDKPTENVRFIMVIPCYNEPFLLETLNSLYACKKPAGTIEILVIINEPEGVDNRVHQQNLQTYHEVLSWKSRYENENFRCCIRYYQQIPVKKAGAGYARKLGMDEATARFNRLNRNDGILCSMDADATVAENYFTALESHFAEFPKTGGVSIYFEHPLRGDQYEPEIYEGIVLYELYQRYYLQALRFTGFPYAFHTVGSCFAVRAETYVKVGGMNQKKAGEDFYFLQKVIPMGHFYEINTTCVYPSPRPSDRVPFGTGPKLLRYQKDTSVLEYTYNMQAFIDLQGFFKRKDHLFKADEDKTGQFLQSMPDVMIDFLNEIQWKDRIREINQNTNSQQSFNKRFFHWFGAFRILKYLNYAHSVQFDFQDIVEATNLLYKKIKHTRAGNEPLAILRAYRGLEIPDIEANS